MMYRDIFAKRVFRYNLKQQKNVPVVPTANHRDGSVIVLVVSLPLVFQIDGMMKMEEYRKIFETNIIHVDCS